MAARGESTRRRPAAKPRPLVDAQPASKQEAAEEKEIFLATDDAWSRDYFNENDFHCLERKLFG